MRRGLFMVPTLSRTRRYYKKPKADLGSLCRRQMCGITSTAHQSAGRAPSAPACACVARIAAGLPSERLPRPPHTRQWLTPGKTPTRQRAVLRELLRRWLIDSASHARPNVAARVHPCTQNKKRPIRGHSRRGAAPAPRQASITDSPASTARRTARTRRAKRG
jgi:hypothetical protein